VKALTIWQPWATLIMIGTKPFEFRRWDYRERERSLEGQRIVIHAGARPSALRAAVADVLRRWRHDFRDFRRDGVIAWARGLVAQRPFAFTWRLAA
jgi:hypothetical protein